MASAANGIRHWCPSQAGLLPPPSPLFSDTPGRGCHDLATHVVSGSHLLIPPGKPMTSSPATLCPHLK